MLTGLGMENTLGKYFTWEVIHLEGSSLEKKFT